MAVSFIDIEIAKKKMRLKNTNYLSSFVSTVWKGEVIMCCFDNLNKKIITNGVFCSQDLDEEDMKQLNKVVYEFICGDE